MILAGNIAADLNVASLAIGTNVNTNSGSVAFDLQNYIGIIGVVLNAVNGAGGTSTQVYLTTGNDTNRSNSINLTGFNFVNISNAMNAATNFQVMGVDTRLTRRYLYANWLATAVGSNSCFDLTVVGQAKYK